MQRSKLYRFLKGGKKKGLSLYLAFWGDRKNGKKGRLECKKARKVATGTK